LPSPPSSSSYDHPPGMSGDPAARPHARSPITEPLPGRIPIDRLRSRLVRARARLPRAVRPAARHMCSGHHRRRPAGRVIELQRAGGRQVGRARPHNQMIGEANRVVCGLPASLSSLAFLVGCLRLRLLSYTRTLDLATTVVGVISWWY
jgi:hypothetical protein